MSIFSSITPFKKTPCDTVGWSLMTRVPCPHPSVRRVPPSVRTRQCPPCQPPSPRRPPPCLRWRVPPPRLHQKDGSGCVPLTSFLEGRKWGVTGNNGKTWHKKECVIFLDADELQKKGDKFGCPWSTRLGVWHSLGSNFEWISLRIGMMPRRSFYIRRPMGPVGGLPTMAEAAPETVTWPSFQKPRKVWRHQKERKFCN